MAVYAALLVILGAGTLVCIIASLVRPGGRETVQDAPEACCGPAAAGDEHDVWCPEHPPARNAPTVVASVDLDPLERLYLAPAYGEEHAS